MDLKTWNCYLEELVGAVERRRPSDPSQDPQFIDVKSLIKQQKTLDPQLWHNEKLKPEIVDRLIKIARQFFKSLDIGPDTLIKDITLTGSLASFNWSDYSDVDLHILLDFNQFENPDLIKDLVRNAASNWNNKHDIKIKGYDVEMYVQDANEPHHSLGVFSLSNNRFLKTPQRYDKKIDSGAVKEKASDLMEKIDDIYDLYAEHDYTLAEKRAEYIINKIRNYRKSGLEQDGPYAIENLVFKVLRRNGYLEKVINLKTNSYDKRMSVNLNEAVGQSQRIKRASMQDLASLPRTGNVVNAIDYAQLSHSKRNTTPKFIVIHHSTSSPAKTLNTWPPRGSRKASTHFEIDKDGTIYIYLNPATQRAWHTAGTGNNQHSIGIDLVGNFAKSPLSESSPQFKALQGLVAYLKRAFGIPDTVLAKPIDGKKITSSEIISKGYGVVGHGHIRNTACPGVIPWHLLGNPIEQSDGEEVELVTEYVNKEKSYILVSGNSHAGGAFPAIKRYYKQLSKSTGKDYKLIRIDAPLGKGGGVDALIGKVGNVISDLSKGGRKPTVDTIVHFGTSRSGNIERLLKRYDILSDDVVIIGTPESKKNYKHHDARARWNEKLKFIVSRMGNKFTYYDTFGLTGDNDLRDNIHLRPAVYTQLFNKVASDLNLSQATKNPFASKYDPGSVTTSKLTKKGPGIGLSPDESSYTASIIKGTKGGDYNIGKNKFLSDFNHLEGKLIPDIYKNFDEFYKDLDKTFGKGAESMFFTHGKDYIFGPEHFSAALKLAQAKDDKKMMSVLKSKSFKQSDGLTKGAIKKTIRNSNTNFQTPEGVVATQQTVMNDVLRAAKDAGADSFTTRLLLKFLQIETNARPKYTFYNPALAKYKGNANRPGRIDGIRAIGSFQILKGGEHAYKKYGYDPAQFGDPYHQAGVVINFINTVRRKYGDDPTKIYLSWNQGGGGVAAIYRALRDNPDVPVESNPSIPSNIARNMKGNYAGSKPLTPRNFIERYRVGKGLG